MKPRIALIMGSDSDLPIVKKAVGVLKDFSIDYEVKIISAHRTPGLLTDYVQNLKSRGFSCIIGFAGMAAHLSGVIAANTILPVIGVPIASSFNGLDALLATVQMPTGIPVATVAVGGGANAAILAVQMLSINDLDLQSKLMDYRAQMCAKIEEKNKDLAL